MLRGISLVAIGTILLTGSQALAQGSAVSFGIPAGASKGSVNIAPIGVEHLAVQPGIPDTYLHIRMSIDNAADGQSWSAFTGEQSIAVGGVDIGPSFAETSSGGPTLLVAPHGRGVLDAFFPVVGAAPASYDVHWCLHRGSETVTNTVTFNAIAPSAPTTYQPAPAPHVSVVFSPAWVPVPIPPHLFVAPRPFIVAPLPPLIRPFPGPPRPRI